VSGAELGREAGISRPAVWKHVEALRAQGYVVRARPRVGYRLVSSPDLLTPERVSPHLHSTLIGGCMVHFDSVVSTNDEARRLADQGATEGTIVVAERQEAGRGRLGRSWVSPPGGVYFSILLRPNLAPVQLSMITLAAAVAVAEGIRQQTGLETRIKWPNDVLLEGRKLVGILTEMAAEADSIRFVVIGIGVNANVDLSAYPVEAREGIASLLAVLGRPVDRPALLAAILNELDSSYRSLREGQFDSILDRWRSLSSTIGSRVRVTTVTETVTGLAMGVDDDGALRVLADDGTERLFHTGEVQHLRQA